MTRPRTQKMNEIQKNTAAKYIVVIFLLYDTSKKWQQMNIFNCHQTINDQLFHFLINLCDMDSI